MEQIFNLRILCEKYFQHQQDLYHVFIDFKKAFDWVWHAALCATMKKYNISTNLIQVIKNLFNKATSAVLFNSSTGNWFRTTVESDRDVYSHPPSSNYFWKESRQMPQKIMKALSARFADDIDGLAGEEEELTNLVERLDKASTAYGMRISDEKTKLITNNKSGINTEIKLNEQKLETVTSFKYLGSVITDEGSKPEILSRIVQTTAALTRLKPVWIDESISLSSKIRLMRSLVTSIVCL